MAAPTPHDSFAQNVFSDPEQAAVIFRAVLPPALLQQLDFAQAKLQRSLFHNEELRERRSDFLFKVPLGDDGEAYLLALLEHQSSVDAVMAARVLVYPSDAPHSRARADINTPRWNSKSPCNFLGGG